MPVTDKEMTFVSSGEGEAILVMTDLVTVKARSENVDGAFVLAEVSSPPQGGPPMLHRHPDEETFYVLEGIFRFETMQDNQVQSVEATAGSVLHIPSMVWHNYKNIGSVPGKLIAVMKPGDMIDFFRELGIPVTDTSNLPRPSGPPDMQRVMAITRKHHVEMLVQQH